MTAEQLLAFQIWGTLPDCDTVTRLTADPLVQRVLYAIRNQAKTLPRIAQDIQADTHSAQAALTHLHRHYLVSHSPDNATWQARIGVFSSDDLRTAQQLAQPYAHAEALILRKAAPAIRDVFEQCWIARRHPWHTMSHIILGGLVADFCTLDRALFRTSSRAAASAAPLQPDGTRWQYTGFELHEGRIYPMLRHAFYHNQHSDAQGGFARWGCLQERRARRPNQPERLFFLGSARQLLTLLCDEDLTCQELSRRSTIPKDAVEDQLHELTSLTPPAIIADGNTFRLNLPILNHQGLLALLTIADEVAETVYRQVLAPYQTQREQASRGRGLLTVLPGPILVREFALEELAEERVIPAPSPDPVPWNAGVWGWLGSMAFWDEVNQAIDRKRP